MIKLVLIVVFFVITIQTASAATVTDSSLVVEKYVSGLSSPTTITFIDSDILVLQKNDGKVRLIRDNILQDDTVLDVSINNISERGLLGIESVGNNVYLFFTESIDGDSLIRNRIYKYFWDGNNLVNPVLITDLPATPGPIHNGGVLVKDRDNTVFAIIGDLNRNGVLQNFPSGEPDNTGVILQVDPLGPIHAMGIRNSFGLAIDPITGNMWDTENGPSGFDEINLVSPNFNSGWEKIMGPATQEQIDSLPGFDSFVYSNPEFSWEHTVVPTSIWIGDTDAINYLNVILVGDCSAGKLYKFALSQSRDSFVFSNPTLYDLVLNANDDSSEIEFGDGFGCITDIDMGPDGFLYVVSLSDGAIYRIVSKELPVTTDSNFNSGGCLIATATYGSELASHVQQLRELRDNSLLQTESGTVFMTGFNQFYYSFSPTIADWERESPVFKEAVKLILTPMISSLSILNYVDMDSEASVLGYGVSLIVLNVGMYFVTPVVVIHTIRKKF